MNDIDAKQRAVDNFNADNLPGTWVRYWTGTRQDPAKYGQTRSKAELLSGHTPVVWVTGHGACIALTHVDPIPGQPDDIEDDSHDLPEPARAAGRVVEYIAANGDGVYDVLDGHPLYARDLEALRRAGEQVAELTAALAQSREQVADYAADNHRAVAQLTAANRRADGLANDLRSAVTANTAWANQSGEQQYLIWSHKQQAWWGPGGHGYRWAITGAGRFPLDKANDHASTRSWPADRKTPPEVVIPAPPLDVLADPERIDGWIDEQIKSATDAKIAARNTEKAEVAR